VKARAYANVAIVKYWGKKSEARVIPTAPSLSVALDKLAVEAEVEFVAGAADEVEIDGVQAEGEEAARVSRFLDRVRPKGQVARVKTRATFPRAAGLASSSAAFAALAAAGAKAGGMQWDEARVAELARLGSGSATRSVTGGWTVWRNERPQRVAEAQHWDLRILVARVRDAPEKKAVSSTEGMRRCMQTSPFYAAFPAMCERDTEAGIAAVRGKNLDALGEIAERQALALHALCLTARPAIVYWTPATLQILTTVKRFTVDAGPHVFVFCSPAEAEATAATLRGLPGVREVIESRPAGGVEIL
jgi:diphosphomevalonate decarboxylase